MKYNLAKIQGQLNGKGELKEPIDLPKGTIVLSSLRAVISSLLVLTCLVPVKEVKR